MRVELCGDLLVEPNSLRQQPSTISSNCSDHHRHKNIQFSELNQIEVPIIVQKGKYSLDDRGQSRVFGFTLNEEEWSLFNKSHLADLEPYERKKMCSLPKSFTPFASTTVGDSVLESDRNLNRSASNSILLRKCESLSPTPSQFLLNVGEPNNNNIAHPSSLSKILLLRKSHEGFQEDEKENWVGDEGWKKADPPLSEGTTGNSSNSSEPTVGAFDKETPFPCAPNVYPVGQQDDGNVGEIEVEFFPISRFPFTHSSTAVGTIGSHPNPIISCAEDQAHYHHHQDLSTSQQTSFPATIYNFNSVDPMLYAECYDEWNANVASLCENNANSTPVGYSDAIAGSSNGFILPSQAGIVDAGSDTFLTYGKGNEGAVPAGKAVEEVNTLSTFLSKFDDKVAAIWGHQGNGRSALGSNYLGVDGCISSASTPLGSSNPWGSPSSDISAAQVPEFRVLQTQQQATNQVSLAADALISAGYGLSHDVYHFEQQAKSQNCRGNTCDLTSISPPKGNYNIMHSMKQYFGTAPPEGEYYIIKRNEAVSTADELEKSLAVVNHASENSGFAVVCPRKSGATKQTDIDLNTMAKALDSIDLENDTEEEWEIVEACNKGKGHGYEGEDLLNSWKTHFRTVEQVESFASARGIDLTESPITAISAHQINPNLPEYRLFDVEIDGEYHVFQRPGQTMFPVKYKVFHQNEKANQTEDLGVDVGSPADSVQMLQAYKAAPDWSKGLSVPAFEFSHGAIGSFPSSTTPVAPYDGDGNLDYPSSEWCNLPKGVEYNGMWGEWAVGDDTSNSLFPTTGGEYCDSGVDGVGSRSDFYDDMFADYEGEYENFSGIGFTFTGFAVNDTDTDYGQFQDATSLSGGDTSSMSGKHTKNSKRSKTRLRPCKYFFLEGSCRRGNDCKFSHDSITCRYWAEGSCLKGQSCPYVHCFIDGKKINNDEEYELPVSETEKQYHLESETDFPALCSTKNTMLSSRQPMSIGFGSGSGDVVRRLEDSLESLTVFTDSNSSVVEEEVNEPRRLFLFERLRASSPPPHIAAEKVGDANTCSKQICDGGGGKSGKQSGNHRDWSETAGSGGGGNRNLSKSKSLGDTNSSAPWMRNSVSRSHSHSYTSATGVSIGIPVKEKRKKKKH